ncbi:hypothetical protein A9Q99_06340 [Gammaproteobacteria bacterium 45_16_T64]|nr:hypothetical protein A9Q99_06340 [Gammaproteobacteria bacterium 45_16_T64]
MRGAGGTNGGIGRFLMGLTMMVAGSYMFLNAIHVTYAFGFSTSFMRVGGMSLTGGMVLVPFIFGIGIIFYNSKNFIGWGLAAASLIMLAFGVISSVKFRLDNMTSFDLLVILTLMVGGIGMFLSSLKTFDR